MSVWDELSKIYFDTVNTDKKVNFTLAYEDYDTGKLPSCKLILNLPEIFEPNYNLNVEILYR